MANPGILPDQEAWRTQIPGPCYADQMDNTARPLIVAVTQRTAIVTLFAGLILVGLASCGAFDFMFKDDNGKTLRLRSNHTCEDCGSALTCPTPEKHDGVPTPATEGE